MNKVFSKNKNNFLEGIIWLDMVRNSRNCNFEASEFK